MSSFARGSHISIQLEHELTQRQALVLTRSEVLLKAGSLVVWVCLSFLVDFSCSRAIQSRFGSRRFLRDEHERAAPPPLSRGAARSCSYLMETALERRSFNFNLCVTSTTGR